jgi:hypothetical protein
MTQSRLCGHRASHLVSAEVGLLTLALVGCAIGAAVDPLDARGPLAIPIPLGGYSAAAGGASSAPSAGFVAPPPFAGAASGGAVELLIAGRGQPPTAGAGTGIAGAAGMAGMVNGAPFDAGSDPKRNMVQPGALCTRAATIQCAGEAHCCLTPTRTVDACRADLAMRCTQELYLDQIAMNPITGFDASATSTGFTLLEEKASQCDVGIVAWAASDTGLRGMLKGTLSAGASCKPAQNITDPPTAGAALASCKEIATTACLPQSILGDWTCAPKNAVGGACVTDGNCAAGTFCHNPNRAPLGKCAALGALGESCSDGGECASRFCKAGLCVSPDQQLAYCPQP